MFEPSFIHKRNQLLMMVIWVLLGILIPTNLFTHAKATFFNIGIALPIAAGLTFMIWKKFWIQPTMYMICSLTFLFIVTLNVTEKDFTHLYFFFLPAYLSCIYSHARNTLLTSILSFCGFLYFGWKDAPRYLIDYEPNELIYFTILFFIFTLVMVTQAKVTQQQFQLRKEKEDEARLLQQEAERQSHYLR